MEPTQTRSNVRKGLLALFVLAALGLGLFFWYPRTNIPAPNLAQYLPASTVFALRVDRASVLGPADHLIAASSPLKNWQDQSRGYWQQLETATGLHINSLLIAVTQDKGILWQSVLFSTSDAITTKISTTLVGQQFNDLSWYPPSTDALHFERITDHVGALLSVQDTQDYTSPSSAAAQLLTADPIAVYTQRDIGQQIADMLGANQAVPGTSAFIASQDEVTAGFSISEPLIRMHWYDTTASSTPSTPLYIPAKFDVAFSGDMRQVFADTTPATHPLLTALQTFINSQASMFSFKPEDLQRSVVQLQGIVISGDQWLMVGDDSTNVADIVSLVIGSHTPKKAVSRLPDGTSYRELVRGIPTPRIEDLGTFKVSVWSDMPISATSTANLNDAYALFTAEKDGKWYLSTSKDMLSMQFGLGTAVAFPETTLIQTCNQAGPIDLSTIDELWAVNGVPETGSSTQKADLAYISLKMNGNKHMHMLCAQ